MEYLIGGAIGVGLMATPCIYLMAKGGELFGQIQDWLEDLDDRSIDGERIYYRNRLGVIRPHFLPPVMARIRAMDLRASRKASKGKSNAR